MGLLDVLLAIIIFVVGMLALASLQGNLTRSSADANARTVGINIAEENIERLRQFQGLWAEVGKFTYQDIVDETLSVPRGGINYTVDITVEDWYFMPDRVSVTNNTGDLPENQDTTISDFKYVELAVSWAGTEFQIDEDAASVGRFGSGDFTVSGIIPSTPALGSAEVVAQDETPPGTPPVDYTPGDRPDIIAIELDGGKFKESTTPEPVVRRKDELIETWFDVITYQGDPDAIFLRREEFVSISCECELHVASGSGEDGRGPTIWTGVEYFEPAMEGKPWGESNTNQQSQYCDVCCRDHHDSGSSVKFRPWVAAGDYIDSGSFADDHRHYNRDKFGDPVEATAEGDIYLEACRLVRKDGFFRVAQDFDLNQINAFPENYLSSDADVIEYSDYVKDVADYNLGQIDVAVEPLPANQVLSYDGRDYDNPTVLPVIVPAADNQQLRSRSLYVDSMNAALNANIENCFGDGDFIDCEAPDAVSVYELYPFYDVQVTHLARWSEDKNDDPVHVTNEELDPRGYSRGRAELAGSELGRSRGISTIESGNVGLISTLPVTYLPAAEYVPTNIFIQANDSDVVPPGGLPEVSGSLTNEGGTSDAAILILEGSTDVTCNKPTVETFTCSIGPGAGALPTIKVSNYYNKSFLLLICSDSPAVVEVSHSNTSTIPADNHTIFSIPVVGVADVTFTISKSGC
jgi:hypothetical protein